MADADTKARIVAEHYAEARAKAEDAADTYLRAKHGPLPEGSGEGSRAGDVQRTHVAAERAALDALVFGHAAAYAARQADKDEAA